MAYANDIVRPIESLPKQRGLKFVGVTETGECVDGHVDENDDAGFHMVMEHSCPRIVGWKYKKQ